MSDLSVLDDRKVRSYFNAQAQNFDAIYTGRKNALARFLDRHLRRDMRRRFEITLEECGGLAGKTVCDVGCGSGRYAVELARRGAARVVGVDYAPNMIALAGAVAEEAGVADVCTFHCADLLAWEAAEVFDISLAIGVFDYVRDPAELLGRIARMTREKVIATFPVRWRVRTPLRKLRLTAEGCPVFFFTERAIGRLFAQAGYRDHRIVYRGQIYVVVATPAAAPVAVVA